MRVLRYTVPAEWDGKTLRDFARKGLGFSARLLTQQRKEEGGVLRNGEPCRTVDPLHAGDRVTFALPEETADYPPVDRALSILWETEDFLAVDKPAGMPVHPSPGHDLDSLLNAAAHHFRETGQQGRLRPLYRLDRDTSGVVVLAKHKLAAGAQMEKRYFAVCQGTLSGRGVLDKPICLEPGSRIKRRCGAGDRAVTRWRALESHGGHTLLALTLETGRTHQIRAHLSDFGFPLAGDDLYGGSREICPRQALHCGWARVICPALSADQALTADFSPDLRTAFSWLPEMEDLRKELDLCPPV